MQMLNFIQQQYRAARPRASFLRVSPGSLPQTRIFGGGAVEANVFSALAELLQQFGEQSGLSHLTRPCKKLDQGPAILAQTVPQGLLGLFVGHIK